MVQFDRQMDGQIIPCGSRDKKKTELRPSKTVKMEETSPGFSAPKSHRELREFLDTLSVDDGILRRTLQHPGLRVWCASFRFEALPGNIPQRGSQVDATLVNIPASGTLLHYHDVTVASIQTLVEAGVPVDETNAEGLTPLYIAVMDKREEKMSTLLELGSDPEKLVEDDAGWTVLHHAVISEGTAATVKRLLDCGCVLIDHQGKGGDPVMQWSTTETHAVLLEYGANMSLKNTAGGDVMEVLHYIYDEGCEDDIEFLMDTEAIWVAEKHRRSPPPNVINVPAKFIQPT